MQFHRMPQPMAPPQPQFLMFYVRFADGSRSRGTYLNANKALLDAWQAFDESERRGILCIVLENGQEIRKVIDYDAHQLTNTDAP